MKKVDPHASQNPYLKLDPQHSFQLSHQFCAKEIYYLFIFILYVISQKEFQKPSIIDKIPPAFTPLKEESRCWIFIFNAENHELEIFELPEKDNKESNPPKFD